MELAEGLRKVNLQLAPHAGFLEVGGGYSSSRGAFAYGDVGLRLNERLSLVGQLRADAWERSAMGGLRYEFGL